MPTEIIDDKNKQVLCNHIDHNPPTQIVIPEGKVLRHTCPSCGKVTVIKPMNITF